MNDQAGTTTDDGFAWYVYELAWILPSIALPVGMLGALLVTSFGAGIHLPTNEGPIARCAVGFGAAGVQAAATANMTSVRRDPTSRHSERSNVPVVRKQHEV